MNYPERKICTRCVLPESLPDISIGADGRCSVCAQHDADANAACDVPTLETDLVKILNRNKGKGKYDCLAMCSGGKDSTSALYYMHRRYKLRTLAFMFDHGFETEDAIENVKKAVDVLGCDFMLLKSEYMKGMFAKILQSGSRAVICHLCSIWYMQLTFDVAARYEIPVIVAGWTKGQSIKQPVMTKCACNISAPEYQSMAKATREFIEQYVRKDPMYNDFPENMEAVVAASKKRFKSIVLSPHWFLPIDQATYVKTITDELGWKPPRLSYPRNSTNCSLNFIAVHNSMKYFGYTHYHIEMSKMIRQGLLTREQALHDLEIFFDTALLNDVGRKLGHAFS